MDTIPNQEGVPTGDQNEMPDAKQVSYDTYLKTLNEAKNAKKRLRELEELERAKSEAELAEKGEYKKLLSQRDEELNKLRSEMLENKKRDSDRRKLASILDGIGGDIDPKFYGLIDYDQVAIDPETGEIDQLSRAKAIESFRVKYPEILPNPRGPRLPHQEPKGEIRNKISRTEWLKLPSSEMRKWKADQIED
jgi:hypothetical protein